ncbi:MAG: hypothetical protein WCL38_01740 [Actinomycetota bacterium]
MRDHQPPRLQTIEQLRAWELQFRSLPELRLRAELDAGLMTSCMGIESPLSEYRHCGPEPLDQQSRSPQRHELSDQRTSDGLVQLPMLEAHVGDAPKPSITLEGITGLGWSVQ